MKLFILHSSAVIGYLGKNTTHVKKFRCPKCNILRGGEPVYEKIEYVFDIWFGEDIITSERAFLVSERLKDRMITEKINGVNFIKSKISKSEYFEIQPEAYQNELPDFYYLSVLTNNIKSSPILFEVTGQCDHCLGDLLDVRKEGIELSLESNEGKEIRNNILIEKNNWHGEDIFALKNEDLIVISEKLKTIFLDFNCRQLELIECLWLE